MLRTRRRPRCGPQGCALVSAVLLLLSVSLLYTRLSLNDAVSSRLPTHHYHYDYDLDAIQQNPLLSDSDDSADASQDKIDELDVLDADDSRLDPPADDDLDLDPAKERRAALSTYYVDHVTGAIRRALNRRSIEEWDYDSGGTASFGWGTRKGEEEGKGAFGSDDVPIDERVRAKIGLVRGIEGALLLKVGGAGVGLREGWGDWFEKKGDFLRRDRMFKSNLESLNPLNNPMLQDPDGVGVTGLTRGDKAVHKWLLYHIRKAPPFLVKRTLGVDGDPKGMSKERSRKVNEVSLGSRKLGNVVKWGEDRGLDDRKVIRLDNDREMGNAARKDGEMLKKVNSESGKLENVVKRGGQRGVDVSLGNGRDTGSLVKKDGEKVKVVPEERRHVYADGRRWGYFPGLDSRLSFSEFVESFFRRWKCGVRVFMVWNSPPWMYGVRHRRGIESLLSMHRDACVIMLSETIELDFFEDSFVKAGYKVAVATPNLDELLKDTPTHVFSSVWFQWRKTKFYPVHYSELVRLAVLYKYGGVYLDSDIIVLNPLSLPNDTVGLADQADDLSVNGAVMAFRKNSPFILECLKEFYSTYDDSHLTWNGADLLTRVAGNMSINEKESSKRLELKVQPSFVFFPISSKDIISYFTTPATEDERLHQDAMFEKIISESLTFHFWNSLTSSLVPDPDSLVARLIDHSCIHCHDVL